MQRLFDSYYVTGRPNEAAILKQKLAELEHAEVRAMLTDVPSVF